MLDLSELSKEQLVELVKLLAGNSTTIDGLWFTQVEDKFGIDAAIDIDMQVWRRYAPIEAKRIKERMGIKEGGLDGFSRALKFSAWVSADGFDATIKKDKDNVVFTVTGCRPQAARIRSGRNEFPCKPVGIEFFKEFVKTFGTDIKVRCLVCPPDEHPDGIWCSWEFATFDKS